MNNKTPLQKELEKLEKQLKQKKKNKKLKKEFTFDDVVEIEELLEDDD